MSVFQILMIIVSLSQCNFPTSFAVLLYLHVLTREVVSPKRPDLVLSADIPDVEARVLVRDGLDVESDGRDGVDFAGGARGELEGVEDGFKEVRLLAGALLAGLACSSQWHGESQAVADFSSIGPTNPLLWCWERKRRTGLSGGVETKHQQAHFFAAEDLGH